MYVPVTLYFLILKSNYPQHINTKQDMCLSDFRLVTNLLSFFSNKILIMYYEY